MESAAVVVELIAIECPLIFLEYSRKQIFCIRVTVLYYNFPPITIAISMFVVSLILSFKFRPVYGGENRYRQKVPVFFNFITLYWCN